MLTVPSPVPPHVLQGLLEAGVDADAAAAYLDLIRVGASTATAVAERLAWPRSKAYRILESMQGEGLVRATVDRPTRFVPAPPEELFRRLRDAREASLEGLDAVRSTLLPVLHAWQAASTAREPARGVFRILRGELAAVRTCLDLLACAPDVLAVEGDLGAGLLAAPTLAAALERAGGRVRRGAWTGGDHPTFLVFGERRLVVAMGGPGRSTRFLETDAPGLVAGFVAAFRRDG